MKKKIFSALLMLVLVFSLAIIPLNARQCNGQQRCVQQRNQQQCLDFKNANCQRQQPQRNSRNREKSAREFGGKIICPQCNSFDFCDNNVVSEKVVPNDYFEKNGARYFNYHKQVLTSADCKKCQFNCANQKEDVAPTEKSCPNCNKNVCPVAKINSEKVVEDKVLRNSQFVTRFCHTNMNCSDVCPDCEYVFGDFEAESEQTTTKTPTAN